MTHQLAAGSFTGTQGLSTAASSTTLSDSSQALTVNAYTGFRIQSYSAGEHTSAIVASNTATQFTINALGWSGGTPDAGKPYMVSSLQDQIGRLYHCGFSDGTHWYGYLLVPDTSESGGYRDRSDITAKQQLTQYSSPNLIDRDFVYWPRVSQGDFSGGMLQPVFINPNQCWDTTCDPRTPGYLTAQPKIASLQVSALVGGFYQVVAANGDVYMAFGEASGNIYRVNSTTLAITTNSAGTITAKLLATDGKNLYTSDGSAIKQRVLTGSAIGAEVAICAASTVAVNQMWLIDQGTNGRWLYYSDLAAPSSLYRIDLNGSLPSAGIQVPLGSLQSSVVDLCAYQTGVAILTARTSTATPTTGAYVGWDVWFFDGLNTTPIVRVPDGRPGGIANCMGNLYVPSSHETTTSPPVLYQITSGSIQPVLRYGLPVQVAAGQVGVGAPIAFEEYLYWTVENPQMTGISGAGGGAGLNLNVLVYNTLTGSLFHTGSFPIATPSLRQIAVLRGAAVGAGQTLLVGGLYYQQTGPTGFGALYTNSVLVTSRFDFGTPGIEKRFRRLEAIHAALPANCSIKIDAFIDKDPVAYTSSLTPDATITNAKTGSVATDFFLSALIGHSAYFAISLLTSDGVSAPTLNWFSVEVSTPRAWEFTFGCTNVREMLSGELDDQGVKGTDLANFWVDAWENPKRLTYFGRDGVAYTVALEAFDRWNPSPKTQGRDAARNPGEEYNVHVVIRETLADS